MGTAKFVLTQTLTEGTTVYGIRSEQTSERTIVYPYISSFRSDALRLLEKLNSEDLSPVHYNDIVEDYLWESFDRILRTNGFRKA